MHSWKKKLVVSQLALACTLAITSQANATTYNTWTYYDNPTTALDWSNMDLPGTVDGNYVNYSGFVYYNNTNGDFDTTFKEGANKQVISSQADSLIKISRIWADFFPANTSNQPI